jgi:hypothetical protein
MRCPIGILVSISQPATVGGGIERLYSSRCDRFCLFAGFLELNHCAAAICGAAVARELLLGRFGDRFVQLHVIIIKQFLAGLDVAQRINKDPVVFLDRFAVWIAGMIDPARVVTANFWINYIAVFQTEVESVWIVVVVGSGFPGDAFACVLDNARAFGNELRGINASTVHTGLANLDLHGSLPSFAFFRHTRVVELFLFLTPASGGIDPIPQWRRLFYAGVPGTRNPDRRGAFLGIARSPTVRAASALP